MSRFEISLVDTAQADDIIRHAVIDVFASSFDVADTSGPVLDQYFATVKSLLLAYVGGELVGFQFYQEKVIGGLTVHHFSLAGRRHGKEFSGLQAQFGSFLIRRAITRVFPWKPVYIAGVTNSPKSYGNMRAVGGRCFPDVMQPVTSNPFGSWYFQVAQELGIKGVDPKGLLRNRMQGLGFSLCSEASSSHPVGRAYERYVENDLRHGVFTLIEIVPVRHIPVYLLRRLLSQRQLNDLARADAR